MKKRYEIGERVYTQDELVLSQDEDLTALLIENGLVPAEVEKGILPGAPGAAPGTNLLDTLKALLKNSVIRKALAIVLVREGATLEDRDTEAEGAYLRHHVKNTLLAEIVADFFDCNTGAVQRFAGLLDLSARLRVQEPKEA